MGTVQPHFVKSWKTKDPVVAKRYPHKVQMWEQEKNGSCNVAFHGALDKEQLLIEDFSKIDE